MIRQLLAGAAALVAVLVTTSPADAAPLREKVSVCRDAENGIRADKLPCVWLAPLQGDQSGHSLIAYESTTRPGKTAVRWLDDDRAAYLWLHAVARRAVPGSHAGTLEERVNLCTQDDGTQSRLPCVWHSPTMTGEPGGSYVVRRDGVHRMPVSDAEGRRLLLAVAYR